jgi:hypothetical protein
MVNDPSADVKKDRNNFNGLDESLKNTKAGKSVKTKLTEINSAVGATAAPVGV